MKAGTFHAGWIVVLLISWHILVQIIWHTRSFLAVPADPGKRLKLHIASEYALPMSFHTRFSHPRADSFPNLGRRLQPPESRKHLRCQHDRLLLYRPGSQVAQRRCLPDRSIAKSNLQRLRSAICEYQRALRIAELHKWRRPLRRTPAPVRGEVGVLESQGRKARERTRSKSRTDGQCIPD